MNFKKLRAALAITLGLMSGLAFGQPVVGTITTQNLNSGTTCTAASCVALNLKDKGTITVQVTGTYTGALSAQITTNGVDWITLAPTPFVPATATDTPTATIASGATGIWRVDVAVGAVSFRVTGLAAMTGTATVTLNPSPLSVGSSSSGGGAGDASAANQTTMINSLSVLDDWDETNRAAVNIISGQAGVAAGNGVSGVTVPRVTIASDSTGVVGLATGSNTIGALTANQSVNVAQINGVTTTMGNGVSGTGVQRVTIASDSTGVVGLATGSNTIGALTANQSVNVAQMNGVATSMGSGTNGTGVQRVTIATDDAMSTAIVGVAHDAVATAVNPALIGLYSSAAAPTGVSTDGDAVRAWGLANGSQVVQLANAGVLTLSGSGTATGALRVELPTNGTGTLAANQSVNVSQVNGVTTLMGAGATGTGSQRVTEANDSQLSAGVGATGDAAATAGSTGSLSAKQRLMTTQLDTIATEVAKIDDSNTQLPTIAHGTAVGTDAVFLKGCVARTANTTAEATGDVVYCPATTVGVPIVYPWSIPDLTWQYASAADVVDTTSTEMKAAVASVRNYVAACTFSNTDATVGTYVNILSATTVIGVVYVTHQTTGVNSLHVTFNPPLRGTANEAINFQAVTTSAQLRTMCQGFASAH